ncbi:MAG: histidine phosphatase family protein [Saprospiraceae bacterium]|nr:histidine phosphatase family protein [Saprospiraceae bacterium]
MTIMFNKNKETNPLLPIRLNISLCRFLLICIPILPACSQTPSAAIPLLQEAGQGVLKFSDGSTREIPHWNDSNYVTLVFVRHCEKVLDGSKNPDLTPEGYARAERLGRIFEQFRLDSVYTTPYRRTQLTAEAVRTRAKLPPVLSYAPEDQPALLTSFLHSAKGKRLLIVGHQNTVPMGLNVLAGAFNYQNLSDFEYGKCFIAVSNGLGQTTVLELNY